MTALQMGFSAPAVLQPASQDGLSQNLPDSRSRRLQCVVDNSAALAAAMAEVMGADNHGVLNTVSADRNRALTNVYNIASEHKPHTLTTDALKLTVEAFAFVVRRTHADDMKEIRRRACYMWNGWFFSLADRSPQDAVETGMQVLARHTISTCYEGKEGYPSFCQRPKNTTIADFRHRVEKALGFAQAKL